MKFDLQTVLWLVLLLPSITLHEFSHGYVAYLLGDPTAKNAGRLSLNPLRHIDPFGTVLLPLLLWFSGGPIFGYAKPVPVNPRYFKNLRQGDLLTGIAGPAANLVLALVGAVLSWSGVAVGAGALGAGLRIVGLMLVETNLVLMFFNLIPIPPLDGSSIIPVFLPDSALPGWFKFQRYSFVVLLAVMWILPQATGIDPLGWYFSHTVLPLLTLLLPG